MSGVLNAADVYNRRYNFSAWRFLYRLNPLAKVAAPLPAMAAVIFTRDIPTPLALIALTLLVLVTGAHLSWKAALAIFAGIPLVVLVMSLSFGIWVDPSGLDQSVVIFQLGEYQFFLSSWLTGLTTAVRLSSLIVLALLSGLTTTGPDLVRSLVQQLHVPYRIGYTALAAYRFVPRFAYELNVIRSAHRVRGIAGGRGPFAWFRRSTGYIVPLLASAIRHAERVALAMDSRAFGAHTVRTERHVILWRVRDTLFVLGFWTATVLVFLFAGAVAGLLF